MTRNILAKFSAEYVMNGKLAADQPQSRDTIMAAVAEVLGSSDGHTTNLESAIARTSVSAQDVSTHFGGNRELILAMVSQLSDSMSAPLINDSTKSELRQRLFEFGQRVSEIYASSGLRSLYRIAITESSRHTGLGRDFYEAGPGRLTQRLAEFLHSAQADGALCAVDPHLLASYFIASLRINLDIADTFSHAAVPVVDEADVSNVVNLFLDGIGGGRTRAELT